MCAVAALLQRLHGAHLGIGGWPNAASTMDHSCCVLDATRKAKNGTRLLEPELDLLGCHLWAPNLTRNSK